MPGPYMNRLDQYLAAPQQIIPQDKQTSFTFVPGTYIYDLPELASNLNGLQVQNYEVSEDIIRSNSGLVDTVTCSGGAFSHLVRLYNDLEEALIPVGVYVIVDAGEQAYNDTTKRIDRTFTITFEATVGSSPTNWSFPLGTPASYIEKEDLPVAVAPPQPRTQAVLPGNKYRIYCEGMANATGAELINGGLKVDLTNCSPKPKAGPVIVYYQAPTNTLLDKS